MISVLLFILGCALFFASMVSALAGSLLWAVPARDAYLWTGRIAFPVASCVLVVFAYGVLCNV